MDGFVVADDLFESLFKGGYVDRFAWKQFNLQTSKYDVHFFCKKCMNTSMHVFQVRVIDGIHYISGQALKIFLRMHGITL